MGPNWQARFAVLVCLVPTNLRFEDRRPSTSDCGMDSGIVGERGFLPSGFCAGCILPEWSFRCEPKMRSEWWLMAKCISVRE